MKQSAEQAWEEGIPLLDAIERYSPEEWWDRSVELRDAIGPHFPDGPIVTPAPPAGTSNISGFRLALLEALRGVQRELEFAITDMLSGEKLRAVGYLKPRRRNAEPKWIPAPLWKIGMIDWANSSLTWEDATYGDVRVIPSPEIRDTENLETEEKRRKARGHSLEEHIKAVYGELKRTGKINFRSLRINERAIQNGVHARLNPTQPSAKIRGIKYEAIRTSESAIRQQERCGFALSLGPDSGVSRPRTVQRFASTDVAPTGEQFSRVLADGQPVST